MSKIQIIRLQNGDDLIANVTHIANALILSEPMLFGLEAGRNGQGNLLLKHFLPVQLLKKNEMRISDEEVFTVLEPDDEFAEFYEHTISRTQKLLNSKDEFDDAEANVDYESLLESFDKHTSSGRMVH